MRRVKKALEYMSYRSEGVRDVWTWARFVRLNGYIPNLKNPRTYNEKILYRKKNAENPLFCLCSDKVRVKDYVAERISSDIVIPTYYEGDTISVGQLKEIIKQKGGCVLKANHNSGHVHILREGYTEESLKNAVEDVCQQLSLDFGKRVNEPWYSCIKPKVLVEQCLSPEVGESSLRDYKFHAFRQLDGTYKLLCAIDFDRSTNHTRSFFDEEFNWLNLAAYKPNIRTVVNKPENYELMCVMAKKLAEPFSYVRVDFYNVNGEIYFGEMTFAPGSGFISNFQSRSHDLWMGNLWQLDPRS